MIRYVRYVSLATPNTIHFQSPNQAFITKSEIMLQFHCEESASGSCGDDMIYRDHLIPYVIQFEL